MPHPKNLMLLFLIFLFGCKEDFTSGSFYRNPTPPELSPQVGEPPNQPVIEDEEVKNPPKRVILIEEVLEKYSVAVPADILFIIDNSGSMESHQQAVINNTAQFMNQFSQIPNLDWKMGLLSSDLANAPYVGFSNTGVLDSQTPGREQIFAEAVGRLGIQGSGKEKFYDPVKQAFTNYPDFNRADSLLDLVFITDTDDQGAQSPQQFLTYLRQTQDPNKEIKLFGVFNQSSQFTCPVTDNLVWQWATSRHLGLITAGMPTKIYKLCDPDFGAQLLELATGLVLSSARATIALTDNVDPATLVIKYNGQVLVVGQHYTYDEGARKIHFPNLDFASDPKVPLKIYYSLR